MAWLFDVKDRCDPQPRGFVPFPFQEAAVDSLDRGLERADSCYGVLATGTGKTEIARMLIERRGAMDGALVISPRVELVGQTADRLRSRGMACGVEQAATRSDAPVTVACYDSLLSRKRYERFLGGTKLVIVDESHLNYTKSALQMLGYFREHGAKVVGLTATPRVGKKDPLSRWYGECAFTYLYRDAMNDGFLVPAKVMLVTLEELDLSACATKYGDYDQAKVDRWMRQERPMQAVRSLIEQTHDNKPSVVFVGSIAHAELLRDQLSRTGLHAAIVHSRMDAEERRQHLRDFEDGTVSIILNVQCLTLGWDHPPVSNLYIARPTMSHDLYGQMFGRGTRPLTGVISGLTTADERKAAIAASAKPHFTIYDIADASVHNQLVTAADVLHPELNATVRKRLREQQRKARVVIDIDAAVVEEQKRLAQEQAAQDMLEMSRRQALLAAGKFSMRERDVFAKADRPQKRRRYTVMLFGKYKRQPFHQVPTDYLRWFTTNINCANKAFMETVRSEYAKRLTNQG